MADNIPNPPEPQGGFQHGGWYQGRQYDATTQTFGAPNQIVVGEKAGQTVSPEVQKQSSTLQTGDPQALQKYFDNYGQVIKDNLKNINLTGAGADAAIGGVINGARPTPPNLQKEYTSLADQYGITTLNKNLVDLQNKKRVIQQSVVNAASDTEAQPGVTADVVAGRESEQQRQANKQIAAVDLEIQTATDQLSAASSMIQMIMGFTQQDYTNASQAYDTMFSQMIQYRELLNSEASTQQKLAEANWQTVANLITTGVLDPTKMNDTQKSQVNNFEVRAGLPTGITSMLATGTYAGATVVDTNPGAGSMTLKMPNGTFQTVTSGQPIAPQKFGQYDYTYNAETGQYDIVPGQGWFGTNFGVPGGLQHISGGAGVGAKLVDPGTGNVYSYPSKLDPEYQSDVKKGWKTQ